MLKMHTKGLSILVLGLSVAACGEYGGRSDSASGGSSSGGASARSMEEHFSGKVQPQLDFCRTCHIPGGVGDVENGHDFMLSASKSQDLANLRASWERLGGNNPTSRLLLMASGHETPHTGGAPWPRGGAQYKNMEILLKCFESTTACDSLLSGGLDVGELLPLLAEGHRGGHTWSRYCEGKDDAVMLPGDSRSLVQPGVNAGKAVYFNAYWKDCHVNAPEEAAKTCGDWRARIERGARLVKGNGVQGATGFLIGDVPASEVLPGFSLTADAYNGMWRTWGLTQRPANYDQLVASRWGVTLGAERNPYPLLGENPNATNGGSGQLPTAMTQLREEDGSWSGKLAPTCHMCHSGQVGVPGEAGLPGALYGSNSLVDLGVMGRDAAMAGYVPGLLFPLFTSVRGTGAITNFQVFSAIALPVAPLNLLNYLLEQKAGSTGSEDPPVWWNYGHRPLKFYDGAMPSDATRILMVANAPLSYAVSKTSYQAVLDWLEQHDQDAAAWLLNVRSPKYPEAIDTALAEQGAILFHSKDLFALSANAGRERPKGGNGSCAGCHGAYSPRYVNDQNYLETPELEGIAGYIVPRNLIGTDPRRVDGNDQSVGQTTERDWFAYPEQRGTANDCGDQNLDRIRGDRENGYMAPPLYGVWASAPYFHNGSVPNVWEVLKSSDRKPIWRRVSAPNDTGLNVVMGFDPSFQRAYDQQNLGWKYEVIPCGMGGAMPYVECNPSDPQANPLLDQVLSVVNANLGLAWNVETFLQIPLTNAQIEDRKIYNTRLYSQDNGGHTFADALTDQERRALIEYLKTL